MGSASIVQEKELWYDRCLEFTQLASLKPEPDEYDHQGQLSSVTTPNLQDILFVRHPDDRVQQVENWIGNTYFNECVDRHLDSRQSLTNMTHAIIQELQTYLGRFLHTTVQKNPALPSRLSESLPSSSSSSLPEQPLVKWTPMSEASIVRRIHERLEMRKVKPMGKSQNHAPIKRLYTTSNVVNESGKMKSMADNAKASNGVSNDDVTGPSVGQFKTFDALVVTAQRHVPKQRKRTKTATNGSASTKTGATKNVSTVPASSNNNSNNGHHSNASVKINISDVSPPGDVATLFHRHRERRRAASIQNTDSLSSNGTMSHNNPITNQTSLDPNDRGVTMRPSGKWQAQYYFGGASRYIGVFEHKSDAYFAYDFVRDYMDEKRKKLREHNITMTKEERNIYVEECRKLAVETTRKRRDWIRRGLATEDDTDVARFMEAAVDDAKKNCS